MGDSAIKAAARKEAIIRAYLLYEVLPRLVPQAGVAEKRKLTEDIVMLLKNRRTRMTPRPLNEEHFENRED
jgi:hypothetical protein